jgi:hypothetical protein
MYNSISESVPQNNQSGFKALWFLSGIIWIKYGYYYQEIILET